MKGPLNAMKCPYMHFVFKNHRFSRFGIRAYLSRCACWTTWRKAGEALVLSFARLVEIWSPSTSGQPTGRLPMGVNGGGMSTKSLSKRKCCCTQTSNNFISISSCWRYQYQIRFSLEVLPAFCTVFCHFCSPCRCSLPLTSTHRSCFLWHILVGCFVGPTKLGVTIKHEDGECNDLRGCYGNHRPCGRWTGKKGDFSMGVAEEYQQTILYRNIMEECEHKTINLWD